MLNQNPLQFSHKTKLTVYYLLTTAVLIKTCICDPDFLAKRKHQNNALPNLFRDLNFKTKKASPFLYFNAYEQETMKQKALSTHKKIAEKITIAGNALTSSPTMYLPPESQDKFSSRWNEVYGNNLCAFAIYCVLNPENSKALALVKTFMDRMANYSDWYVAISRNIDEVPVAHSLTGFATAYDFLYPYFEPIRRKTYLKKIEQETKNLYEILIKRRSGWTRQYIHNHAPTNLLAMLLGGLIAENHGVPEAKQWLLLTREQFDKAMTILANVIDGSLDEGVAYGSYTSRGITQYIFLAKRHFTVDHTSNPWLQEHFWFYFSTLLPGFQRSVGIADSNHNWFYGPESQLVFLDNYVMRNGYGNWLADKIRSSRSQTPPIASSNSQKWSTVHTEFIFYDESLHPVEPQLPMNSSLMLFSDWGVATYGGGQPQTRGNTFLSFKSSSINGEAVRDIIENKRYSDWINGWQNFNPGHEHPDQNSFVFAPNGRYFITEGLYSQKFSYLNNVLLFSPFKNSKCNQPWQGQIGECNKWLEYKHEVIPRGEILSCSESGGMVFMAGESASAYPKDLNLDSVFRALLLINPEVLVVIDSVQLQAGSPVNQLSAMFTNTLHKFKPYKQIGYNGAKVDFPEGSYKMFWFSQQQQSPAANIKDFSYNGEASKRTSSSLNVTYDFIGASKLMVYVFYGPSSTVESAWFHHNENSRNLLSVIVDGLEYKINLGIDTNVKDVRRSTAQMRQVSTGFGGYASVDVNGNRYYFGVGAQIKVKDKAIDQSDNTEQNYKHFKYFGEEVSQIEDIRKTLSDWSSNRGDNFIVYKAALHTNSGIGYPVIILAIVLFLLIAFLVSNRKRKLKLGYMLMKICLLKYFARTIFRSLRSFISVLAGVWVVILWIQFFCNGAWDNNCSMSYGAKEDVLLENSDDVSMANFTIPFIVISQLPSSGAEVMEIVFDNLTDYTYIPVGNEDGVSVPVSQRNSNSPNILHWTKNTDKVATGWFVSLQKITKVFFNNQPSSKWVQKIKKLVRQNENAIRVLNLLSGFWSSKLDWLNHVLGSQGIKFIIVVKDPRKWIEDLRCAPIQLENDKQHNIKTVIEEFTGTEQYNLMLNEEIPNEYTTFFDQINNKPLSDVQKLAAMWTINTLSSIRKALQSIDRNHLQIVRIEDFYSHPERTLRSIFAKNGMPVPATKVNQILRHVKSEQIMKANKLNSKYTTRICIGLTEVETKETEEIAGAVMHMLNYK